jgi:hypothetical protein
MGKGINDLYNKICLDLSENKFNFTDWILDNTFCPGMICNTVAWYVKTDRWYLDEANYDPMREEDSTWYAKKYTGKYPTSNTLSVMKYFKLEKDERLITTNGKERPVILLKEAKDSWWNPAISSAHEKFWLCIPLFSYKDRHSQDYVLNDQRLNNEIAFYIPPWHGNCPGINMESSARYHAIQMVKEEHLIPLKRMCATREPQMNRPFGLTPLGFELLMYHFYTGFHLFPELENADTYYSLFKEEVNKRILKALNSPP